MWKPEPESNSIAIIIQHMSGNMVSRWTDLLTSDGEKPWRSRDKEFEDVVFTVDAASWTLKQGWDCLLKAVDSLREEDLLRTILIRNEPHSVLDAIDRQLAHYAYHVGQIVYIAKARKGSDWKSLSVPKGKSEEFNKSMFTRDK